VIEAGSVTGESDSVGQSGTAVRLRHVRQVLLALGAALVPDGTERDLETTFERQVGQLLDLRAVRLREVRARYQARLVTPTRTADSIVLGVPTSDPRVQAVLEASCDPARPLDAPDMELLTALAQLGGLVLEVARGRAASRGRPTLAIAPLVGSTRVMQELRARVDRVAMTDFTVLVEGESGTGKELVARQLHELSRRRTGPFVAVNCAAVVETLLEAELFGIEERTATGVRGRRGKFEHADGGTLFLDEVSDLSLSAQAKLLRVIQDLAVERVGGQGARRVNTRIIAATNRPLSDLTTRGLFRTDLYYRLSGVEIHVPPLRSRREDIPELARYFLDRHRQNRELTLSPQVEEALSLHQWPGNVRELERLMERSVALAEDDRIELDDLPPAVRGEYEETLGPALAGDESFRKWGSRYARLVFERCGRNKRRACRVLDISYHTLQAYLRYSDRRAREQAKHLPAWVRSASDTAESERSGI
jgi:transcriptional regulator with PAS, ATPase and Fis domain